MDWTVILNSVLVVAGIIALLALTWFLISMAKTMKSAKKLVDDIDAELTPTMGNVYEMTSALKPAVERIDPILENVDQLTKSLNPTVEKIEPIMDRLTTTVDAVNLELMRVDQIMENVTSISDSANSAVSSLDSVVAAPAKMLDAIAGGIRGVSRKKA